MPAGGEVALTASWLAQLRTLGLELPEPPSPLGSYATASQAGELLFLSGMLPLAKGELAFRCRVGAELSIEQGRQAAVLALLNGLAIARRFVSDPDRMERVVRLSVALVAAPDFTQHAAVADGASEVLARIFAGASRHARLTFGVQSLVLGAPIALDLIVAVRS